MCLSRLTPIFDVAQVINMSLSRLTLIFDVSQVINMSLSRLTPIFDVAQVNKLELICMFNSMIMTTYPVVHLNKRITYFIRNSHVEVILLIY